ncbi:ribosome biogenesis protein nep1, putative [Toxoplasma gondii ME49]|uniref:Nucleolar essential protein 1, putative n=12 Tax=Toxoplasma gondii TaxID=5811 RepID=B6K984_TOXGV|nr:ribosome biogenesis protein nep1, putative [Toxoplasma gondii ME49]ESS35211.1 putative ribosome biogenesis protein nep1 [Toxoplasma gondii VEG]KFG37584.1 putative ribosome biogenesis protein nep1 [Toxoplasma gondii GAB2-2007-GAL-DOM2]KFH09931.1 putative ribosome biogenesis protein nep1 [Toxoplasma gondii VAND]EPT25862.1 ribosome biogenesis protein nep1, putative [Toxoplasma gondii ME49]CEL77637.1 TPA: nucleolar essential protein 1, putative [Toxoplasma gondii VEG]|eukprot:XP_002364608.1 ribosome biogenesis protein nep1, putative [Toxoplasma gondii ME49]
MDAEGRGYMRPVEAIASTRERRLTGQRVIVVLEGASLELAQGKDRSLQLLNSLEHKQLLRKCDRQGDEVRPDIAHHCLLSLQESPLNRAGRLCVFIRTADRQLIEISPLLTVPPTYQEFAKLMTNLLYARRLKAVEKNVTLAQIVKNEHANFLPPNSVKVALTVSGRSVALSDFVQRFKETDTPVVFVVGAVAHSDPTGECDYVDDKISIAGVGLTAAVCCSSICAEFEALWDIF